MTASLASPLSHLQIARAWGARACDSFQVDARVSHVPDDDSLVSIGHFANTGQSMAIPALYPASDGLTTWPPDAGVDRSHSAHRPRDRARRRTTTTRKVL